MDDDLVNMLTGQPVSCRPWPEQVEGPYFRDMHLDRRNIAEDRIGLPLRLRLRLVDAVTEQPLTGAHVELWQADHEGRYSGFRPFRAAPGQVVTSESIPRDIVAPAETFLRGSQQTDDQGMCAFDSIYPGWYSSRSVHIHLSVHLVDFHAITQLYFPEEITDQVFARAPYAQREPRDTINDTDSIFIDGGERTILNLIGDATNGFIGLVCLTVDPRPAPPSSPTDEAG